MINEGWLCGVRAVTVKTSVSLDDLPMESPQADYQIRMLSMRVNTPSRNRGVVESWTLYASDIRSTLVFAVDIAHVNALCEQFKLAGHHAEKITSKTARSERVKLITDFRSGRIPILVNCGILSEGTDVSTVWHMRI